jgi:hypothetical protein
MARVTISRQRFAATIPSKDEVLGCQAMRPWGQGAAADTEQSPPVLAPWTVMATRSSATSYAGVELTRRG